MELKTCFAWHLYKDAAPAALTFSYSSPLGRGRVRERSLPATADAAAAGRASGGGWQARQAGRLYRRGTLLKTGVGSRPRI